MMKCHLCNTSILPLQRIPAIHNGDTVFLCNDCARTTPIHRCMGCSMTHLDPDDSLLGTNGLLCQECRDDIRSVSVSTCNRCGALFSTTALGGCGCRSPRTRHTSEILPLGAIHRWGHNPPLKYHMGEKEKRTATTLFVGFELEVEPADYESQDRRDGARILADVGERWLWAKHDGSLKNGFEIVSHPFTWQFFVDGGKDARLQELFLQLLDVDYISESSHRCGLHIHMSRRATTKGTLYKMIRFIYDDIPFVTEIGGRPASDTYLRKYSNFGLPLDSVVRKVTGDLNDGRYVAVNTVMPNTIELRWMKGTLNFEAFMKSLEMAVALHDFCASASISHVDTPHFLKWLRKGDYPYLYAFLQWSGRLPADPDSPTQRRDKTLYSERP